ncbi:universal stress protein [Neolewinella persica]|uniref:universal stress protein n=1 Tax=Neolewinella persica TaxID=70998 RepID=UPI0003796973|nr:universal stress protein [Neolewinella persica]
MPKIIVPTDFSETSGVALNYASYLAGATGFDLEVLHIHDGYGETDRLVEKKGNMAARMQAQRAIDAFVRFHTDPVNFTGNGEGSTNTLPIIKSSEVVGSPTDAIVEASKDEDVVLIVMGGVGSGRVTTISPVFGSVARSVAMKAACPVFLIPPGYGKPDIRVISISFEKVAPLQETCAGMDFLRKALKPEIRFVHVQDIDSSEEVKVELELLQVVMDSSWPGYPVELDMLSHGLASDKLTDYTLKENVDLLVLGRRKRGFFKRLFISSDTAPLLSSSAVPVLVVPIGEY